MKKTVVMMLLTVAVMASSECDKTLHDIVVNKDMYLIGNSTQYAKNVVAGVSKAEKVCKGMKQELAATKAEYTKYIANDKKLGIRQNPIGYISKDNK